MAKSDQLQPGLIERNDIEVNTPGLKNFPTQCVVFGLRRLHTPEALPTRGVERNETAIGLVRISPLNS